MPIKPMDYRGRPSGESSPHIIASALAGVLEEFAAVLEQRQREQTQGGVQAALDVSSYPALEEALRYAGERIHRAN